MIIDTLHSRIRIKLVFAIQLMSLMGVRPEKPLNQMPGTGLHGEENCVMYIWIGLVRLREMRRFGLRGDKF